LIYSVLYNGQTYKFDSQDDAVAFGRLLAKSEDAEVRVIRWDVVMDITPEDWRT